MELRTGANGNGSLTALAGVLTGMRRGVRADGLDGQEDELEDVEKGKLDPPTDDEGPGSVDEANRKGESLESEDEDDGLVRRIEQRGTPDPRGEGGSSDWDESIENLDELARKAGVKLPS